MATWTGHPDYQKGRLRGRSARWSQLHNRHQYHQHHQHPLNDHALVEIGLYELQLLQQRQEVQHIQRWKGELLDGDPRPAKQIEAVKAQQRHVREGKRQPAQGIYAQGDEAQWDVSSKGW